MAFTAGCATAPVEPTNLSHIKAEIAEYIDSGRYMNQIRKVSAAAIAWIERRTAAEAMSTAKQSSPALTVVFDIDETLLSNLPHMRAMDFGYVPAAWDAWVARGEAPSIQPVMAVYQRARLLGLDVIFITGRRERDRAGTERNLRAVGAGDYAMIFFRPDNTTGTSERFKTATREHLASDGRSIIANIGDQESDLAGGFAERTFKLPDPFYLTK
ncbi:MAG: HAD family acid phosphatase [Opitutaceae bacterium]